MKKPKKVFTDFLFSTPDFTTGAGSVMNLFGNYYEFNTSINGFEADHTALSNDFNMIGQDIRDILDEISIDRKKLVA